MFVAPGSTPDIGHKLTRTAAERIARNWSMLLLNGALLVVAGTLIFSIDWTVRALATFIGTLFILQGARWRRSPPASTSACASTRRARLTADPPDVAGVAYAVGYDSASKLSRVFGAPPSREATGTREPSLAQGGRRSR
jgi:hypothetical protein